MCGDGKGKGLDRKDVAWRLHPWQQLACQASGTENAQLLRCMLQTKRMLMLLTNRS
jgi:hypothetical protein